MSDPVGDRGIPLGQYLQERIQEALAPLHRQLADEQRRLVDAFGAPQLSGAEYRRALRVIRSRCSSRLRHLGRTVVTPHNVAAATGVGLELRERKDGRIQRYAVEGHSSSALSDPAQFADEATDRILAWYSRYSAGNAPANVEEHMS